VRHPWRSPLQRGQLDQAEVLLRDVGDNADLPDPRDRARHPLITPQIRILQGDDVLKTVAARSGQSIALGRTRHARSQIQPAPGERERPPKRQQRQPPRQ